MYYYMLSDATDKRRDMVYPVKYGWERLDREGAYVHVPDKEPSKVSHLAKAYVRNHLHPDAKVVTAATPIGTFVAVAFVPRPEAPPPQPEIVEPPQENKQAKLREARAVNRQMAEQERQLKGRDALRQTLAHARRDTEGYGENETPPGRDEDPDNIWR